MINIKTIPSLKIMMDTDKYNSLMELISKGENYSEDNIREKSIRLKNKLLKYSIPNKNENGEIEINVLLYVKEIADILEIIVSTNEICISDNYFDKLIETRENYLKNK